MGRPTDCQYGALPRATVKERLEGGGTLPISAGQLEM